MPPAEGWARTAATLPQSARRDRERPFWQALRAAWGWERVADVGCGAGFHLDLLGELGVTAVGVDLAVDALAVATRGRSAAADLLAPALRPAAFDGVLCLGNTVSLLAARAVQRRGLSALAALLRPDGVLLVQGEDAAAIVAHGPVARLRSLPEGGVHLRVFARRGRRVEMLAAGAAREGETPLATTSLLPTGAAEVRRLGRACGLAAVDLPASPPGGPATWWVAMAATR